MTKGVVNLRSSDPVKDESEKQFFLTKPKN